MTDRSLRGASPFNPGFGAVEDSVFVGRHSLIEELTRHAWGGDAAGDAVARTHRGGESRRVRHAGSYILFGARGSGKTAALIEAEQIVRRNGQFAMYVQAGKDADLQAELQRELWNLVGTLDVQRKYGSKWETAFQLNLPLISIVRRRGPDQQSERVGDIPGLLQEMDKLAAEWDTTVMLCVDELHDANANDLGALARGVQLTLSHGTKRFHFRGAALPLFWHGSVRRQAQSFFRRSMERALEPVSELEARRALATIANSWDGKFEAEALELASTLCEGSPYMMHLIGHYSWVGSIAPQRPISVADVTVALKAARSDYTRTVCRYTLDDLTDTELAAVEVIANEPFVHRAEEVAAKVASTRGLKDRSVETIVDRLVDYKILEADDQEHLRVMVGSGLPGYVLADRFRPPGAPRRDIGEYRDSAQASISPERAIRDGARPDSAQRDYVRCGAWMPNAKAQCVLRRGHRGPHRSTSPKRGR